MNLIKIFSSAFGLGYVPKAPGTAGSLLGVLIFYLYVLVSLHEPGPFNFFLFLAFTVGLTIISIFVSDKAEKIFGEKDCQKIVIDEVVGQMVTYLFVIYFLQADVIVGFGFNLLLGFVLFRIFDVVKIFPANRAQNLPGGWGVVADDVVAGVQAVLVLWGVNTLL